MMMIHQMMKIITIVLLVVLILVVVEGTKENWNGRIEGVICAQVSNSFVVCRLSFCLVD